jgi:hypothetical protein
MEEKKVLVGRATSSEGLLNREGVSGRSEGMNDWKHPETVVANRKACMDVRKQHGRSCGKLNVGWERARVAFGE